MKTLWITYEFENDNNAYATLFEGGEIIDKDNEIIFRDFNEIKPTIDDVNTILKVFRQAKKRMEEDKND